MKKYLIIISFSIAVLFGLGAFFLPQPYWQPLAINVCTMFLSIGVAIIVVNIYLDRASRKGAIISIYHLCLKEIAEFHNTFLDIIWTRFGKDEFGAIRKQYIDANGDPMVLTPAIRSTLYELAKNRNDEISRLCSSIDFVLAEASLLSGWDLDPKLLMRMLNTRQSIRKYKAIVFNDSDDAIKSVAECLIDIDNFSTDILSVLERLGGIEEE